MGLDITVGVLSDLLANDLEGADHVRQEFQATAEAMTAAGLAPHREPADADVWSASGYGYTGLHALREVAGLIWLGKPIPLDRIITGQDTPAADALFNAALAAATGQLRPRGLLDRLLGRSPVAEPLPPFIHLVMHSDAQGYYVPTDFAVPVIPAAIAEDMAHLWPLGSVQQLAAELATIAAVLELPADPPSADDVLERYLEQDSRPAQVAPWQAQPVATYSLLLLRAACDWSQRTGAAIYFG